MKLRRDKPTVRALEAPSGAQLLLITGTPGSGKRVIGNLLVDEHLFVHVDLDNLHANRRFLGNGVDGLRAELEANIEPGQDMVVTWTPGSDDALSFVRLMQSFGFDWVWVDGDRGAAFRASFRRLNGTRPRFVDPFDREGAFRPLAAVVKELTEPGEAPVPVPARRQPVRDVLVASRSRFVRAPARRPRTPALPGPRLGLRVRTGVAGGLAFATVAAAAVGAYVVAGDTDSGHAVAGKTAQAKPAALPRRGLLVAGRSLAGVRLGDSAGTVRALWGKNFTVCRDCKPTTWFYLYPSGDPVGAGVKFRNGRVTAVFTLGMTKGWRTEEGLRVGDLIDSSSSPVGRWRLCSGYGAQSIRSGSAVTSILTNGPIVYGFSLTRPWEPVCH
jgi:hypothetical protein